jgi:hypothetical protein
VIGIPDEEAGEVPVAILKHSPDDRDVSTRVKQGILETMGPAYSLDRVLTLCELGLDDWPKTTSGKVLKRDLQVLVNQLLERERVSGRSRKTNGDVLHEETRLEHFLLDFAEEHDMLINNVDDDFLAAGLDSLLALRLRNAVIREVGRTRAHFQLGLEEVFACGNIRHLAAHITASVNSRQDIDSSERHTGSTLEMMSDMVEEFRVVRPRKSISTSRMLSRKNVVGIVQNIHKPETHWYPASYWSHWLIRRPRIVHITGTFRCGCRLLCGPRRRPSWPLTGII